MELDELKVQLKQKLNAPAFEKSTGDLSALLNKKAQSLVEKIKRSLLIEVVVCVVFIILFAALSICSNYPAITIYFSVFTIVCIVFLVIVWYLFKKTKRLSNTILPVKSNLLILLSVIRQFINRYLQLAMTLVPVCTVFSFILGYNNSQPNLIQLQHPYFVQLHSNVPLIIFSVVYIVLISAATYYFTRWYLKKLYGNYIQQLQQLVSELEDE